MPRILDRALTALVVLALVTAGVAAYRLDLIEPWYDHLHDEFLGASPAPAGPAAVPPPPELDLPPLTEPAPVADPVAGGPVAPAKISAALTPFLADPDLGRRVLATVAELTSGRRVLDLSEGAAIPASTTKLLTVVAAIEALGPETRFATRVVAGGPGRVVLVGGGDPFLMREPVDPSDSGDPTYPERADIITLAQRTAAALREQGRRRVAVGYDDSLFTGPTFNPAWPASYVDEEVVSPITALWVDQGREEVGFDRVLDPSLTAAQEFVSALGQAGIEVVVVPEHGVAGGSGRELAAVQSAPVREIVERVLEVSDNEAAEVLAHHVGRAVVGAASFADGVTGTLRTLRRLGVRTSGIEVYDGSGLSRENRITPEALVGVLRAAALSESAPLRSVIAGLPVAGFTGSLTTRFDEGFPGARGLVRAKTGTLTAVSSLAGILVDQDGNELVFVLMADRIAKPDELDAQDALDLAAGALGACRCGRPVR